MCVCMFDVMLCENYYLKMFLIFNFSNGEIICKIYNYNNKFYLFIRRYFYF